MGIEEVSGNTVRGVTRETRVGTGVSQGMYVDLPTTLVDIVQYREGASLVKVPM